MTKLTKTFRDENNNLSKFKWCNFWILAKKEESKLNVQPLSFVKVLSCLPKD